MVKLRLIKAGKYWKIRNVTRKITYKTKYSKRSAEIKKKIMENWLKKYLAGKKTKKCKKTTMRNCRK